MLEEKRNVFFVQYKEGATLLAILKVDVNVFFNPSRHCPRGYSLPEDEITWHDFKPAKTELISLS